MAGKGRPPLATSHYPIAPESRRLSRPDQTYHPPPHPCTMGLTSIFKKSRVFPLKPPHGLHTHSSGLQYPLGRQLSKAGTAGRILAGAGYPYIGHSSRKLSFPDTFCTPVTPKPEFSRNTHPCGWQGSSSPSNFPLPTCYGKSTFDQARPNLPPTPSPMHIGLTSISQKSRVFPLKPPHGLHTHLMWSTMPTRSPTPESGHSRENTSRSRVPLYRPFQQEIIISRHFSYPVAPKPEFSRNTHPCGWQGSSSPSNFPLPTCYRKSTFVQARPNLPPTPSPMPNGFDLDFPKIQSFPAETATWATYPLMWSTMPTRSPTPESGHSRENTSRSRVPLYRPFQQEIIISRHFSYPRSSLTRVFPKYSPMWLARVVLP